MTSCFPLPRLHHLYPGSGGLGVRFFTGAGRLATSPTPSWPLSFNPHAQTWPRASVAEVTPHSVETSVMVGVPGGKATATGVAESTVVLLPS